MLGLFVRHRFDGIGLDFAPAAVISDAALTGTHYLQRVPEETPV